VTIAEIAPVSPIVSALATLLLIAWMLRAQDRWPLDVQRTLAARPSWCRAPAGIAMMAGVFSGFAICKPRSWSCFPRDAVALSHFDDLRGRPSRSGSGAQLAAAAGFAFGLSAVAPRSWFLIVIGILWVTNLYTSWTAPTARRA